MPRRTRGFTLVELLVVIAVIGILVALLLPAVQAARERARAAQCTNNLRQIALATHAFHDAIGVFPPASYKPLWTAPYAENCGDASMTWLVTIMPYLEQKALYKQFDWTLPFVAQVQATREAALAAYLCPTRRGMGDSGSPDQWVTFTAPCGCSGQQFLPGGATSDYAANLGDLSPGATGADTDFYWGGNGTGVIITVRPRCENESPVDWIDRISMAQVADGTSHTTLIGELHVPLDKLNVAPEHGAAYNGMHFASYARVGGPGAPLAPNASWVDPNLFSFGSWHPGICHFAMTDASVRAMKVETSTTVLGHLCHRNDGWPQGE